MSDAAQPSASPTTGGCQCGAVRYAFTGKPEETSLCSCRMCQKAGGGPFMVFGRVPAEALSWTRGRPTLFQSSTVATRGFCSRCGTPLTYQYRADAVSLTAGSLDDPRLFVPESTLGLEAALPWTRSIATLPGDTTDNWMPPELQARFQTRQHPDHDG